jgi:hypothetical protein
MKKNLKKRRGARLFFCLVLILALCLVYSSAQEKMKFGGEITVKYLTQETQEIGNAAGHAVTLSTLEGINKSTGEQTFMDGAKVLIIGMTDATQGNGSAWGYSTMTLGDDEVFAKYKGKVTTTISEGNPITTFEVEAKFIKGTGKYANIQGGYKAKAKVISETELAIKSEGAYVIKE